MSSTQYGLTDERNSDGSRKEVEHTYDFEGQEVTVKLLPPTISEVEEYERLEAKDEIDADKLKEIVREHIKKPEINDPTMREVRCYVQAILDYSHGGGELAEMAEAELEKRDGSTGN